MLKYDRIDVSESMEINRTDDSRECCICHYYYFTEKICIKYVDGKMIYYKNPWG